MRGGGEDEDNDLLTDMFATLFGTHCVVCMHAYICTHISSFIVALFKVTNISSEKFMLFYYQAWSYYQKINYRKIKYFNIEFYGLQQPTTLHTL